MAICPECHSKKPFLAPRCHNCNQHIGLVGQFVTQLWFFGGQIIGLFLIYILFRAIF